MPVITVGRGAIDYELLPADAGNDEPPLVFLHEGLGSVSLWRSFVDEVTVGRRRPRRPGLLPARIRPLRPRPAAAQPDYMHHEALVVLPELLATLGIERPVLIGHSDGASIASSTPAPATLGRRLVLSRRMSSSRTGVLGGDRGGAADAT